MCPRIVVIVVVGLLAGCGVSAEVPWGGAPDAASPDAGELPDRDASAPVEVDAGELTDQDGGPIDEPDAGPVTIDAGPIAIDAGPITVDAGPIDAGSPDAGSPVATEITCSVLVAGGGLGGVAAAHEAASLGADTCVVEPTQWLGGQATSQGVSALDEGYIDGHYEFSSTYAEFRNRLRARYFARGTIVDRANETAEPGAFDPGSCWVSRLCFEPRVGVDVLEGELLAPLVASGKLRIFKGFAPTAVDRSGNRVTGVRFASSSGAVLVVRAAMTIDATELGDLLPLAGAAYRVGKEAWGDTEEPSAELADPECVQPFTYTFAVERRPEGENHAIARPARYDASNFSLGTWRMFPTAEPAWAFWNYRRLLYAPNFTGGVPRDVALINWGNPLGNDFARDCGPEGCNVIDKPADVQARIYGRGRDRALEFLYWLQHDVPRDDGGRGYPNLLLRTDVMGTSDGLSMVPYVRESRRLRALELVRETDVAGPATDRGTLYDDTVGIGHYALDIHPCARGDVTLRDGSARAMEIPLGALIPVTIDGLLAGAKNLGVTHIANGAYRVHPVEWSIGQAAGAVAATSVRDGVQPRALRADTNRLRRLQAALVAGRGGPLFWWNDLPRTHPAWVATQLLGAARILVGSPGSLNFDPDGQLPRAQAAVIVARTFDFAPVTDCHPSFSDVPCSHYAYFAVQALADRGITSGVGGGAFAPDVAIPRAHLATLFVRAAGWSVGSATGGRFSDVPASHPQAAFVEAGATHGLFAGEAEDGWGFAPDAIATRQVAARWAWNVLRTRWGVR